MINNDKVKLMTRIQLFENHEKEALKANRFFQRDYMGIYLFRSLLAYIVLFFLILVVVFLYNWEDLLTSMNMETMTQYAQGVLLLFFLFLIPCMIISYMVYWFRYRSYRKKIKGYVTDLKQLDLFYERQAETDSWIEN